MLEEIIKQLEKREEYLNDGDIGIHSINYTNIAKSIIKIIETQKPLYIRKLSFDQIEKIKQYENKTNTVPVWWQGIETISKDVIDRAERFISESPKLLQIFFQSSSDANKYLEAKQQEQMEKDFEIWLQSKIEKGV